MTISFVIIFDCILIIFDHLTAICTITILRMYRIRYHLPDHRLLSDPFSLSRIWLTRFNSLSFIFYHPS